METFERGGYTVEFDRAATIAAYQQIAKGGADLCDCDSCDNFAHFRTRAFPGEFVSLLVSFGIDPRKEGEAYECGKDESGLYLYGGWFHFVGAVLRVGAEIELNGCRYWFDPRGQVPLLAIIGKRTFLNFCRPGSGLNGPLAGVTTPQVAPADRNTRPRNRVVVIERGP